MPQATLSLNQLYSRDDNEGNLWVGSGEKLWRVDNGKKSTQNSPFTRRKGCIIDCHFLQQKNADYRDFRF